MSPASVPGRAPGRRSLPDDSLQRLPVHFDLHLLLRLHHVGAEEPVSAIGEQVIAELVAERQLPGQVALLDRIAPVVLAAQGRAAQQVARDLRDQVRAERRRYTKDEVETVISERPMGVFSRQLFLGDTLNTEKLEASYDNGVLTLRIPISAKAKPRKIAISGSSGGPRQISA